MARDGITEKQVADAADALVAAKQQPTIRAVREALGTGSPNTVHRHLATWRKGRLDGALVTSALSANLLGAIAQEIEQAAVLARADVSERLAQSEAEALDLAKAGEILEQEIEELREQVATVTSERDSLSGKASQQTEAMADLSRRTNEEIARLREAVEKEMQGRIAAEQTAAVHGAKLEAMTDRAAKAEAKIEQAEKQSQHAIQELNNARIQIHAQQAGLDAAARETAEAKAQAKEYREESKRARDEAAELKGMLAAASPKKAPKAQPKPRKVQDGLLPE